MKQPDTEKYRTRYIKVFSKKLIKKEKKQLIALFISLISLIIFSLIDNKIDKIFLFFFIGDLIIIFVDVCLELKKDWKGKKDKK